MSVRIVRMRNGEDVICDLFEVTTKEKPEDVVAFQLVHPYNVCVLEQEPELVIEGEESNDYTNIHKISDPEINFTPWAPLAKDRKIMLKMEEVVTAYETGNGNKTDAIKDTFRRVLSDEYQAKASKLGYIPLEGDILQKARDAVERISK